MAEEFAILCRGIALGHAGMLGERLRSLVEATQFVFETQLIPVTVSVGVSAYPEIAVQNGLELIAASDEALYGAKRSGRNRVVLKQ